MDAVKFMKEYNRMCKSYFDNEACKECPLKNNYCFETYLVPENEISYEDVANTVKAWSKENPEEIGKKYIIEIDAVDNSSYHCYRTSIGWLSKSQLANLEEYKEHDACKGCKYEDKAEKEEPCVHCRYAYRNKWEAKR